MPAASRAHARATEHLERYVRFGGLPVAHDASLDATEREDWLRDYVRTYLERDVADLASLRDLEPFVSCQRVLATRTGRLVNFADLARSAQVSPDTARRFPRTLELGHQTLLLQPYRVNAEKRLARQPKVHFLDAGVARAVGQRRGEPSGEGTGAGHARNGMIGPPCPTVPCVGLAAQRGPARARRFVHGSLEFVALNLDFALTSGRVAATEADWRAIFRSERATR